VIFPLGSESYKASLSLAALLVRGFSMLKSLPGLIIGIGLLNLASGDNSAFLIANVSLECSSSYSLSNFLLVSDSSQSSTSIATADF